MATTQRNGLIWRLGVIFVAGVLPVSACLENAARGPYTTWFNQRLMARATAARLVGQPESQVERVLGPASAIKFNQRTHPVADGGIELRDPTARTFDYDPLPFWPFGKVQVFCTHGVVTGLEMFDD